MVFKLKVKEGGESPPFSIGGAIWARRDMYARDHRVLWWMIDAGAFKIPLGRGWINLCAVDLKMSRATVDRALRKMEKMKILHKEGVGFYVIKPEALASYVDPEKVKNREAHLYAYRRKG